MNHLRAATFGVQALKPVCPAVALQTASELAPANIIQAVAPVPVSKVQNNRLQFSADYIDSLNN
jgi:hypothetical protein